MNTSRATSRSRYTTALPAFAADAQHELRNAASSQAANQAFPYQSESGLKVQDSVEPLRVLDRHVSHDSQGSPSKLDRQRAVRQADSLLPYQRPLRNNDTRALAAELGLTQGSNSSSDWTSSTQARSLSDGSDSSNSHFNEHEIDSIEVTKKEPLHAPSLNPSLHSSNLKTPDDSSSNLSPPRSRPRVIIQESAEKIPTQTQQPPAPILPPKNPKRAGPPSQQDLRSRSEISSHQGISPVRSLGSTHVRHPSELKAFPIPLPQPIIVGDEGLGKRRTVRKLPLATVDQQPDVDYESVEGVELDTQPAAAPEKKTGLSLPEIEARDVRHIPNPKNDGGTDRDLIDSDSFFARSPALPGANRHINTHTVPPRSVAEQQEHVFLLENNPHVRERDTSDRLPQPVQVASELYEESVGRTQPIHVPQLARHSSATRGSFETPTTIPEDSREDLPDVLACDDEDPAEPPPIALSKEFEQRDGRMTHAIQTAKSLISKML